MEKDATTADPSSFTLLVSSPSGLLPSQVSVAFSDAYDRIPHSDISLENTIYEIWEQRSLKNNSLFNGMKFRYGDYVLDAGDGSDSEPSLCLHLGLTDYRCDLSAPLLNDFCGDKFKSFVGEVPGSIRRAM